MYSLRKALSTRGRTLQFNTSKSQRDFSTQQKLFSKLLVANRGEIACRIFRTCRDLGIKTVAVYSEADAKSQHVKLADEAVCIGPASALESYLIPERILQACKITGADAVHPGYGFLSENADFSKLLEDNGITFVGPKHETIRKMGDKIKSKMYAEKANVKHIPGFVGAIRDEEHLLEVANKIGYPVMVKAAHGGGGKGMRRANNDEECRQGYRLSLNEARTSFNSSTMLVEKFIEDPRHIEFQVLADKFGNAVFVHERECSVQRRNQKLIEEAPSTFLTPEQRATIGAEAVALALISGYENAGTVEFLMDKHGQHYYLEMNTRLQVEHPITEAISGLDLVEQQIRIAAGLPLELKQEDIKINGWAVEARVCAEDPVNDFLPSVGTLTKYVRPEGCRVDDGFVEGDNISIYYDSLLAKVITHAPTRDEALALQAKALDSTVIRGISTNMCFLREVMQHPKFIEGKLTTNFIADNFPHGFTGHKLTNYEVSVLLSAAANVHLNKAVEKILSERNFPRELDFSQLLSDYDNTNIVCDFGATSEDGTPLPIYAKYEILYLCQQTWLVSFTPLDSLNGNPVGERIVCQFHANFQPSSPTFTLETLSAEHTLQHMNYASNGNKFSLLFLGSPYHFECYSPAEAKIAHILPEKEHIDLSKSILSPMPGSIYSLSVKPGDQVVAGQELCIVEAMKMQNSIKATKPAVVKAVHVTQGATVSGDQLLIELE